MNRMNKFTENDEYQPSNSTTPLDYNNSGSKYDDSIKIEDFKKSVLLKSSPLFWLLFRE